MMAEQGAKISLDWAINSTCAGFVGTYLQLPREDYELSENALLGTGSAWGSKITEKGYAQDKDIIN